MFDVPVVLTTVAAQTFSGALLPEIQAIFPDQAPIDRTTMNSWEDKKFNAAVTGYGRESDRERADAAGVDHHLVKPVALPAIVKLIEG